jgi:hypothetical protein
MTDGPCWRLGDRFCASLANGRKRCPKGTCWLEQARQERLDLDEHATKVEAGLGAWRHPDDADTWVDDLLAERRAEVADEADDKED